MADPTPESVAQEDILFAQWYDRVFEAGHQKGFVQGIEAAGQAITGLTPEPCGATLVREPLSTTLEDLDLTVRTYNGLKREEINTIGELLRYPVDRLLRLHGFNQSCIDELRRKVKPYVLGEATL